MHEQYGTPMPNLRSDAQPEIKIISRTNDLNEIDRAERFVIDNVRIDNMF